MDEKPVLPQWRSDDSQPSASAPAGMPEIASVRWTASEFISHQKTISWYLLFGGGAAIMTFFVILITGSIMSGLVVVMASIALIVFAARQPETKQYEINDAGISVNNRLYPYEIFKSFSVVEEGAVDSIWLRPLKRYVPTMVIYFATDDEDKIINTLENFLPEEARALDIIDRASRRIRF